MTNAAPLSWMVRARAILALGLIFLPVIVGPAGATGWTLRRAQELDARAIGIDRPQGIAWVPEAERFLLSPAGVPDGTPTTLRGLTMLREPAGQVALPFEIEQGGWTYDPLARRLLVYESRHNVLHSIPARADGTFDTAGETRTEIPHAGLVSAAAMAVDPESGEIFLLDRLTRRVLSWIPGAAEPRWIGLEALEGAELGGLAFEPTRRHLFVLDSEKARLFELDATGELVAAVELESLGLAEPQGIVFAPSGDLTDDPARYSLFLADAGSASHGLVVELAWQSPDAAPPAPISIAASLVRTVATSGFSPPSPDPSGITWDPVRGRLVIVDGEVEEMSIWDDVNAWEVTLAGTVLRTWDATPFTDEPVGIAFDATSRHYFVSDDDARRVFDVAPGPDGLLGTSDDVRRSFSTSAFGCTDPEGISYDRAGRRLFISDGLNEEVYVLTPGSNGVFDGGGDDGITHFDTSVLGVVDPETVEFNEDAGTLFLLGRTGRKVREVTIAGSLVSEIDIGFAPLDNPAGLAYAPSSAGSATKSFYIVNRRVDNDQVPSENDGTMLEILVGSAPPPPPPPPTGAFDLRIASGSDDAEQAAGGTMYLSSTDLELVYDGSNQTVGLRFPNVPLAPGTSIDRAWVQFTTDEAQSEPTSLSIRGQAIDHAPAFGTSSGNLSGRALTTANVSWSPAAWSSVNEAGANQSTPDLAPILRQIVGRPGWASGNAIVLLISGTGHRTAQAYENSSSRAPLLHVEFGPPNQAPAVDAGPNRTVTLPASAAVDGTVTDDGLPSPPSLTTLWSFVSGPGSVTFANANAVDTQASFAAPGTYRLRLTATDGSLAASDSMQVTVLPAPPNAPPVVSAGPDRTVALNANAALDGTVTDDGLPVPPGAFTVAWSVVSGPGAVTFTSPNAVDTNAGFTAAGMYVLRLTANDGGVSASDDVQVTALPGTFEQRVTNSADDAEETPGGSVTLNSSDLELVDDGSTNQRVGVRIRNVTIPRGATIVSAWIQFVADESQSVATNLVISGQAADNAAAFTTGTVNVSVRPRTAASVTWAPPAWTVGQALAAQRTPDLSAIVSQIVGRSGWASGNAMAFIITGVGHRTARAYDEGASTAALLHIEYR